MMVAGAIGVLIWWTKFRQAVSISRNIKWPRRVTDKKDLIRLYSTREVLEEHKTLFLFVFNCLLMLIQSYLFLYIMTL